MSGRYRYLLVVIVAAALVVGGFNVAQPPSAGGENAQAGAPVPHQENRAWESLGIGAGGALYYPAGSPHDPKVIFVSSDMGGFYRSEDGGSNWQMLDWRMIPHVRSPIFHPTDPNVVYALSWGGSWAKISNDRGRTWKPLPGPWEKDSGVQSLTIDRGNSQLCLLSGEKNLYRSTDGGKTWSTVEGAPGGFIGQLIDQTSPTDKRVCFGATTGGVFRSDDGGLTWTEKSKGLPWRELRGFSGGSDPKTGRVAIYCTVPSKMQGGKFEGGVYRSTDRGETWEQAMGPGINTRGADEYFFIAQAETHPDIVYVTDRGTGGEPPDAYTVYRSDDAGKTWRFSYMSDPRFKENNTEVGWLFWEASRGWGDFALGFGVNAANPDQAFYTNYGEVFMTTDGAKTWQAVYSRRVEGQGEAKAGQRWTGAGLEDTTCWRYVFDPHDRNRTYICYTDIGFARSEDRGKTWYSAMRTLPWRNTVYQLACDPEVPGLLWSAGSNQHDIPTWRYIQGAKGPGGVAVSTDYGKTWAKCSNGLPVAPVTALILDPTSPKDARVLYAGVYGSGIYKSADGGKSWVNKSEGIVPEKNRQVYSIQRWKDGTLYCSVAGRRAGPGVETNLPGGLYKSADGAGTWTRLTPDEVYRPVDFAVHPDEANIIYVAAMDGLGHKGGLYKTTDGGKNWTLSVPDYDKDLSSYIEGFTVTLSPKNPNLIYFCTHTHGLFLSRDAGKTWEAATPKNSPPFLNCIRLYWDPEDEKTVYIVTFGGGVWRGPDPME